MRDAVLQIERTFGVTRDELPEDLSRLAAELEREREAEKERRDSEAHNGR